jgi:hypothetical protein
MARKNLKKNLLQKYMRGSERDAIKRRFVLGVIP